MSPLPQLTVGSLFARDYRVVRPLSAGGMGAVYIVEQESTRRLRALKIMLPGLVQDPRNRERFAQEASISGRIQSDHIVEVVAAGIDDATSTPWLVMELLEGEDLQTVMNRAGPLSLADTHEVFRQLCHGLGAAHQGGLVHRDLKPENVFLCVPRREGVAFTVKILDFGIAKVIGESRTSAMATSSVGSPLWMAPEQAEQGVIRPATDVWALGLLAFYLLTGRFYWRTANTEDVTLASILKEIFVDAIDPPSQRAAEYGRAERLPPGFDAWFAGCTVRDAAARFRDGTAALAAFTPMAAAALATQGAGGGSRLSVQSPGLPARLSETAPRISQTVGWQPPVGYVPPQFPRMDHSNRVVLWLALASGVTMMLGALGAMAFVLLRSRAATPTYVTSGGNIPGVLHALRCSPRMCGRDVGGLSHVAQVRAGRYHTCAVTTDGALACWGWNATRQLGDGGTEDHYVPTVVPGVSNVAEVAAGDTYTCALLRDGTVQCWGILARPYNFPTGVEGAVGMTEIAAGEGHACGRRVDATAWCWGRNGSGELGDGSTVGRERAVQVQGLVGVAQVAPGGEFSCALVTDGTVWCWGKDDQGQLGDGTHGRDPRAGPTRVLGLTGAVRVAAGEQHACALLRDGTVQCWGWNMQGQLGYGAEGGNRSTATMVPGLTGVMDLALGYHHTCVRHADGTAACWGENFTCQLGGGTAMTGVNTPARVEGLDAVADLAGGGMHTCARRTNGTVRCWGFDFYGQLGNGTTSQRPDLD